MHNLKQVGIAAFSKTLETNHTSLYLGLCVGGHPIYIYFKHCVGGHLKLVVGGHLNRLYFELCPGSFSLNLEFCVVQ